MAKSGHKDADDILDYFFDWSRELAKGTPDTITASTWLPEAGITVDSETFTTDDATVWLSGGTEGECYNVVNRVNTALGRQMDETLEIWIRSN